MADAKTEPETVSTAPPDGEAVPEGAPAWFGPAIDQHIAAALGKLFDTGQATVAEGDGKPAGDPAKRAPDAGVADEVRQAMHEVFTAEELRRKEEGRDAETTALKAEVARLAALKEKPPRQYNRITLWMWGDPDD